jgi:hypothetical protein
LKLCNVLYEVALGRHPNEVAAIMAKLRHGKSRERLASPDTLEWYYECCLRVDGLSIQDIVSGKAAEKSAQEKTRAFEEQVADRIQRTGTCLHAKKGRWWAGELVPNPPEVEAMARREVRQRIDEQAAYDALPPEEKERQFQECLRELSKDPGFMALQVSVK